MIVYKIYSKWWSSVMGLNDSCEGIIEMGGEGGFAGPAKSS